MALYFDWTNLVIESTTSITDLVVFHNALRDWEDSAEGVIHPVTHRWKALSLGNGGFFYQCDLINGWSLKFPNAGNYTISGNLNGTIAPVVGVYVERQTSASYVTTSVGVSGPTAPDIAAAVWQKIIENGLTAEELLRVLTAVSAGNATGLTTGSTDFRSLDNSKSRVLGTVVDGNRNITTVDGT